MEDEHKYIDDMQDDSKEDENFEYLPSDQQDQEIILYPVTDPKKPFVCQHCGVGKLLFLNSIFSSKQNLLFYIRFRSRKGATIAHENSR